MNAIVKVDFHGDTVTAVREGDSILVAVKPIIDRLGLDWSAQLQRLKRDEVLEEGMVIITIPSPGGAQDTIGLPLELLPGFLFGISTGSISDPDVRAAALAYKRECYAVLYRHFFGQREAEDVDWDALTEKLNLVKQARLTYGRKAAQGMWERLGLPPVDGGTEKPLAANYEGMFAYLHDFLDECTEQGGGFMVLAGELFKLYTAWAKANNAPFFTAVGFGKAIAQSGIRKRRSNQTYYLGVRIRHDMRARLTGLP